jgi:YD repeat-containing protein
LVFATNGSGMITSVTDPMGRQWVYSYNSGDDLTAVTDPMGNKTSYSYGEGSTDNPLLANNLISATSPNAQPGGPDAGDDTAMTYDADGLLATQSFSLTNVQIWGLAIGVERGESGGAVLEMARPVDQSKITYRTRHACFLADVGRGLAREPRTQADAVRWLRRAEDAGPQLIRNRPAARETVAYLLNRARADAGGRELRGMAARMGVVH